MRRIRWKRALEVIHYILACCLCYKNVECKDVNGLTFWNSHGIKCDESDDLKFDSLCQNRGRQYSS